MRYIRAMAESPPRGFFWTRTATMLDSTGTALVPAGGQEEFADGYDAVWLRAAELGADPQAAVAASSMYGWLKEPGERVLSWVTTLRTLRDIAHFWGDPSDTALDELHPPSGSGPLALYEARERATQLRANAVRGDDVVVGVGTWGFEFTPRSLYGVIAIQASAAVAELPSFKRCHYCKGWFRVYRSSRKYCIDRHKWAKDAPGKGG